MPTIDSWGRTRYTVAEQPYRLLVTRSTSAPGCYGWHSHSFSFATMEEAEIEASKVKGARNIIIQVAENTETWNRNGKWKTIKKIK